MSIDERTELAALLPPASAETPLPRADVQRDALLRELNRPQPRRRRWRIPTPALAAGALAVTVALTAVGGVVLHHTGEPVRPAGPGKITRLDQLLNRVDASVASQGAFAYAGPWYLTIKYVSQTKVGVVFRTDYFSVDGSRPDSRGDNPDVRSTVAPAPGKSPVDAAIQHATLDRLFRAYLPAHATRTAMLVAIERAVAAGKPADPDGAAFAKVGEMLRLAGLASPSIRASLYHTAALIPGAYLVPDAVDQLKRHAPAIALTSGGETQLIMVNPTDGMLLAEGVADGTKLSTAIVGYGFAQEIGAELNQYHRPDLSGRIAPSKPNRNTPSPSPTPDQSIRAFDPANATFELPLDLTAAPTVKGGLDSGSGGPKATFKNGVALVPAGDEHPLKLTIDTKRFPIAYLTPTAAQVNPLAPLECSAIVIEIQPTDPSVKQAPAYAVIGFAASQGPLFPGPQTFVQLVTGGPGPVVTARGDTLTVTDHPGGTVHRYQRSATGYAPAK